jgi:hypothetical protein
MESVVASADFILGLAVTPFSDIGIRLGALTFPEPLFVSSSGRTRH